MGDHIISDQAKVESYSAEGSMREERRKENLEGTCNPSDHSTRPSDHIISDFTPKDSSFTVNSSSSHDEYVLSDKEKTHTRRIKRSRKKNRSAEKQNISPIDIKGSTTRLTSRSTARGVRTKNRNSEKKFELKVKESRPRFKTKRSRSSTSLSTESYCKFCSQMTVSSCSTTGEMNTLERISPTNARSRKSEYSNKSFSTPNTRSKFESDTSTLSRDGKIDTYKEDITCHALPTGLNVLRNQVHVMDTNNRQPIPPDRPSNLFPAYLPNDTFSDSSNRRMTQSSIPHTIPRSLQNHGVEYGNALQPQKSVVHSGRRSILLRLFEDNNNKRTFRSSFSRILRTSSLNSDERAFEGYHGVLVVSWYDGTTTAELRTHVTNSVSRKLERDVLDIRILDE